MGLKLTGRYILNTRPVGQNTELTELLTSKGAEVLECPLLKIVPLDFSKDLPFVKPALPQTSWLLFTSANGVQSFSEGLAKLQGNTGNIFSIPAAAIGAKTAEIVRAHKYNLQFVSDHSYSEGFATDFVEHVKKMGQQAKACKIFLVRGTTASDVLPEMLLPQQFEVYQITAYDVELPKIPEDVLTRLYHGLGMVQSSERRFDVVALTSSHAIKNFYSLVLNFSQDGINIWNDHIVKFPVVVIGVKTANAASDLGFRSVFISKEPSVSSIVQAIEGALD